MGLGKCEKVLSLLMEWKNVVELRAIYLLRLTAYSVAAEPYS